MASVVFLRGVNVGGHKTFRPSLVAQELSRYDVVNIGAAGTFVVRKPVSQATLRDALSRRLPFETQVMICSGASLARFTASNPFSAQSSSAGVVPFVSVLAQARRPRQPLPLKLPATGEWGLQILGQDGRFVFGVYRRNMRAIGYLGQVDRVFGVPATTRNWNTMRSIARILATPA